MDLVPQPPQRLLAQQHATKRKDPAHASSLTDLVGLVPEQYLHRAASLTAGEPGCAWPPGAELKWPGDVQAAMATLQRVWAL
jgi:hypothetical protein